MALKVILCVVLILALALDNGLGARGEDPIHHDGPPKVKGSSETGRILRTVPTGPNPLHNQSPPPEVEGWRGTERILRTVPTGPNPLHNDSPPPIIEG